MNDVTEALSKAVAEACGRHPSAPVGPSGAASDAPQWNQSLWSALDDIGILLLPVPEDHGGAGGDVATTTAVLEVLGAESATVPYAETALLAGWLLSEVNAPIPVGPLTACLAGDELSIVRDRDELVLDGRIARVPWARCADSVVLLVGGDVLVLRREQYDLGPGANLAGEPRDDLYFSAARIGPVQIHALGPDTTVDDSRFIERSALGRMALMTVAARRALELSLRYASERRQFGRSLDNFQAVQQYLATMAGEVMLCKMSAEAAASAADRAEEQGDYASSSVAIAAAMISVAEAAGAVARTAHQVHGAVGFTEEHDLRLSTTRIWSWRDERPGGGSWSARLASMVLEAGPDGLWPLVTG